MTEHLRRASLGILALLSFANLATAQHAQVPETRLIDWLERGTLQERAAAVAYVKKLEPEQRGLELDRALAAELARLNLEARRRRVLSRAGTAFEADFQGHYYGDTIEAVSRSSHPDVIAALVGALGTGWLPNRALARFGEIAVRPVLAVAGHRGPLDGSAADAEVTPEMVRGALSTLQLMVESPTSLPPALKAEVAAVARQRLSGRQHGAVVSAACGLAMAIGEPTAVRRVGQLGSDPSRVPDLEIGPAWAARVQRACKSALAKR